MSDATILGGSFTLAEWCQRRRLSRSSLYKLWAIGRGPKVIRSPDGKKITITAEADADWARAQEADWSAAVERDKASA